MNHCTEILTRVAIAGLLTGVGASAAWAGNPGDWLATRYVNFSAANSGAVVDQSYSAILLPDGGVMLVGRGQAAPAGQVDFAMAQLDAQLVPNADFSAGTGKSLFQVEAMMGGDAEGTAVARQRDGKFLVCGRAYDSVTSYQVAVLRVLPDGTRDSSFGTDGVALFNAVPGHTGTHLFCRSILELANGEILTAGEGYYTDGSSTNRVYGSFVARLDQYGTLDPNFSGNGTVFYHTLGAGDVISPLWYAMAVDANNRIYLAGAGSITVSGNWISAYLLARLRANGSLDTSYSGGSGYLATHFSSDPYEDDTALAIHLFADNSAFVAGDDNVPDPTNGHFVMSLLKVTSDGFLQGNFGTSGRATADFQQDGYFDSAYALTVQPDGSIVLAGESDHASGLSDLALARFNPDGSLDSGFGNYQPGLSLYSPGNDIVAKAVVFSPRSRNLIVTGYSALGGGRNAFMASSFEADDTELIFSDGFE